MTDGALPRLCLDPLRVGRPRWPRLAIAVVLVLLGWTATSSVANARGSGAAAHIPTWATDDGCGGGAGAATELVRHWVSYAETNCGVSARKALRDCHAHGRVYCNVMQYLDTDWSYPGDRVRIASATPSFWWLHLPAPHQSTDIFSGYLGGGYLINQRIPSVRTSFRSFVRRHYNSDDGLMMDWQSPSLAQELYYSTCGCRTTAEIHSDSALRGAHAQMSAALTHRNGSSFMQTNNTLPSNPFLPQGLNMLNRRIGVDAWSAEGEPMDGGTLDPYYSTLLDQIAYISTRTRGFVVPMSRASVNAPYLTQTRRVQEATVLLGFRPGHMVDWANLEVGSSRLAVWPEEGIYPQSPVQSMGVPGGHGCLAGTGIVCSHGGHRSLEVADGIYRREFRSCYLNRVRIGGCAAIMNSTARYVAVRASWLRGRYGHQMTFVGGDVQSRGAVDLTGAPFRSGTTLVGPHDAALLAR
jgi:hypothetical protein